jgi:hypothetical protein
VRIIRVDLDRLETWLRLYRIAKVRQRYAGALRVRFPADYAGQERARLRLLLDQVTERELRDYPQDIIDEYKEARQWANR